MGGHRTGHHRASRTIAAAVAAGAGLSLVVASIAEAKPPPSPGLRVVWVADALSAAEGRVRARPSPGYWPEIERVELGIEGMRAQGTGEAKRPAFDAWGRRLPTPRVSDRVIR